jgi:pimeloyl-ACP methyl ester carboxylesterase
MAENQDQDRAEDQDQDQAENQDRIQKPDHSTRFTQAYDAVLAQWLVPVDVLELKSEYGTTRVNACGPTSAPPLILLPGGGATSTVWFANVAALSTNHRVYAVDVICDHGRSIASGTPVTSLPALMAWLDTVLDSLEIASAALCGHSYSAWIALQYALHTQSRVSKLALLDPTQSFTGFNPVFLLRALPVMLSPSPQRTLKNLVWETSGADLDPAWLTLLAAEAASPRPKYVTATPAKADALRTLTMPVLLLLAGRTKAHSIARVEAKARAGIRDLTVSTLSEASHFTIPALHADDVNRELLAFLG